MQGFLQPITPSLMLRGEPISASKIYFSGGGETDRFARDGRDNARTGQELYLLRSYERSARWRRAFERPRRPCAPHCPKQGCSSGTCRSNARMSCARQELYLLRSYERSARWRRAFDRLHRIDIRRGNRGSVSDIICRHRISATN